MIVSRVLLGVLVFIFLTGCANKELEKNKPAEYWYQKIIKEASRGNVEAAGDYYSSLQGEHIKSPLLGEAMLIMAKAHMQQEEYLLANFYYDEYIKRFGAKNDIEYIKFLKLRANYYGLKNPKRDQKLIIDTKKESQAYIIGYSDSNYKIFAQTIITNISATEDEMNQDIARLYEKIDKPEASMYYKDKKASSFVAGVDLKEPESSWLRELFE